jgi:hypothetical protein
MVLSNPTQTAVEGLRDAAKTWLYRSAMRDIFGIDFGMFCNLRTRHGKNVILSREVLSASLEG